ncbi:thiamine biosynthesis protein ThiJ [Carbonactinospora thermoautotrophica]|uniref:Thiamine biosynthesis protein ThiJ n=1 Tax=Carbonactinospora thermoautotrophica TaxID=1469144 RepID=A0A132N4F8_9ACTN|nr:DJ-1/PfpI family protein [Carbonactinospora thermoautotrophica]KWX04352.1 thiamine biosynthesis protein ThiJ [Carbonactinospora thermoautotrophica]KWX04917.1 thiamine biosynthesis protein ThiJ [Carbonactinospora thermoautotrophica]
MAKKLLMVVSSARSMKLADGSDHPTGYWAEEVLEPYERFEQAGVDLVIATPDGKQPQPDPWGLEPYFHYPQDDEDFMLSVCRSFAPDVDDIRVTLDHLIRLNLIAVRRLFHALVETGMDRLRAREVLESAARTAWSKNIDLVEVLAGVDEVTERLSLDRINAIKDEVWQDSAANAREVAEKLAAIPGLQHPKSLAELTDEEIRSFDGVFIPGGHGPMVDLVDNPDMRRVLRILHEENKTIAALCHGPAALLSAPVVDGVWLFEGYKMTAFTDEEEDQTKAGRLGMEWYLESALKNRGAIFDDGDAAWVSHVVVDRNLITAQNPASSEAAADAVLKRLEV